MEAAPHGTSVSFDAQERKKDGKTKVCIVRGFWQMDFVVALLLLLSVPL